MMMKNFEKDFVERTKSIIENQRVQQDEKYEVTLLLNCLLGLISVAVENTDLMDSNETPFMKTCVEKLDEMGVLTKTTDEKKTFRAIKNALSHVHIELGNYEGKINKVTFGDKRDRNAKDYHTILEFTVKQLREYALFIADLHLERCDNKTK